MRMMSLVSRTSRRSALILVLGSLFVLALIVVIKDLNDKLGVMTASNQNYQRMTDKQMERIKSLQSSLKKEEEDHESKAKKLRISESETKEKLEREQNNLKRGLEAVKMELKSVHAEKETLQREYDKLSRNVLESNHRLNQMSTENAKLGVENERLKEQMAHFAEIAADRDRYKNQYLALFKQYQASSDSIQNLQQEKEMLKLQLQDDLNNFAPSQEQQRHVVNLNQPKSSSSSSLSPGLQQLKEPSDVIVKQGKFKSSPRPKIQVEQQQPFVPNARISSTSEASANKNAPPVGAEPPLKDQNNFIKHDEIHKEDVMEAPKADEEEEEEEPLEFNQYFHQPQLLRQPQPEQQLYGRQQQQQPLDKPNVQKIYHMPQQVRNNNNNNYQYHDLSGYHQQPQQAAMNINNNYRQQPQHDFGRPPMRFQRREVDSPGNQPRIPSGAARPQFPYTAFGDQDVGGGEQDETGPDPYPLASRRKTIDHDENEDSNAGEEENFPFHSKYNINNNLNDVNRINPASFGIHQVNNEENHLKRFHQPQQRYMNAQDQKYFHNFL